MDKSSLQISQLITRIWDKTHSGELSWEQFSDRSKFQTRLGDFVISLSGSKNLGSPITIVLSVRKLDGNTVANISVGPINVMNFTFEHEQLTPPSEATLRQLYSHLSNKNTDLDALLNLLK